MIDDAIIERSGNVVVYKKRSFVFLKSTMMEFEAQKNVFFDFFISHYPKRPEIVEVCMTK